MRIVDIHTNESGHKLAIWSPEFVASGQRAMRHISWDRSVINANRRERRVRIPCFYALLWTHIKLATRQAVAAILLTCVLVLLAGAAFSTEIVQEQRWTVQDSAGNTISQHDQQHVAIRRAGELSAENDRAVYYVVGNRLRVRADAPTDPVDPIDPPPVIDPPGPTPSTGWLARAPHADAEHLLPGADLQAALDTGRDVLLPAGSEWPKSVTINNDGQLLGVYGAGDRPLVPGIRVNADDITVAGLRIANDKRNPDAPGFDLDQPETTGIYVAGEQSGLLVEDCVIEYLAKGIVLQGESGGLGPLGCTIHRNIIRYNWNKGDRGAGIYTNRARNLRVTENLIDHNGWHPALNADRDGPEFARGLQAHGCYFSGRYNSGVPDKWAEADKGDEFVVEFHGNIVSRSSANGCQFRLGGNVTDNVFVGQPMALYTWTNASQVHRNAILNGTHVDYSDEFYQRGWGIQIITGGDYTDNLIANVSRAAAGSHAIVYEASSARVNGNTFYNWRAEGKDSGVYDKNDSGLDRVTDNADIIGGLDATLTAEQIEQIAGRERGVWGDEYDGAVISEQLREAYR